MEGLQKRAELLSDELNKALSNISFDKIITEAAELQNRISQPDFWNDPEEAAKVSKKHAELLARAEPWQKLSASTSEIQELISLKDTELTGGIEKQLEEAEAAVILALSRINGGKTEYLFQERLKNPYFGYWGLPSGKIRWGETITETARRESLEETGLDGDFEVKGVYHEHVIQEENEEMLEDKIFFVVLGTNMHGAMLEDFEGGHNQWMTFETAMKKKKRFQSFEQEIEILDAKCWLVEQTVRVTKDLF